jgi:acetyl esterase
MNIETDPTGGRLDPQMAAATRKSQEIAASLGPPADLDDLRRKLAEERKWWNQGGPTIAKVTAERIPGPIRDIPVVVYHPYPSARLPAFVFLHGGGWRFGNEWSNDRQMREIAAAWGGVVVSADYAHMPEHVFPAAVDEAVAVYGFLAAHGARWGIDGGSIAFGGASAGANVSCGAVHVLGGTRTGFLKAGALIVGALDADFDTPSAREFGAMFAPPLEVLRGLREQYVPDPADWTDPRFLSLAIDMAIMPPMFLAAAELDVRRDSSQAMARRLAEAGRPHTLKIYPGMTHLFFEYTRTVDRAAECARDLAAFLGQQLPAR